MAEEVVRISRKHQIVVPKDARERLGLSAGDRLIVRVEDNSLVMKPKPSSYTKFMQGLHKGRVEGHRCFCICRKRAKSLVEIKKDFRNIIEEFKTLALGTQVFIYHFQNSTYLPLTQTIFEVTNMEKRTLQY